MHLSRSTTHTVWDNAIEPVATVPPGETVTIEVANSSGGQIIRDSTVDAVTNLNFDNVNPVTGPLAVVGAEPGDSIVVDIIDIDVDTWGWTAAIPGFGLLADHFPEPHLRISTITRADVEFLPCLHLPAVPMIGTIGLAPAEPGPAPMVPPHRGGGNMDIRHVTAGARLLLPVAVAGGLLSVGDTHAAQGDGEVCGTGRRARWSRSASVSTRRVGFLRVHGVRPPLRHRRIGLQLQQQRARGAAVSCPGGRFC
ncbi:MAG: acetamidase/formamidase family protein [Nocardioidaceae bacterium]